VLRARALSSSKVARITTPVHTEMAWCGGDFLLTDAGSMLKSSLMSAHTGTAPCIKIGQLDAVHVRGVVTTSSPLAIPASRSARCKAVGPALKASTRDW